MEVPVDIDGELTPRLRYLMIDAAEELDGVDVTYRRARPDEQAINIFPERLSMPNPHLILASELRALIEPVVNPFPNAEPHKVLYFDIETHNAGKQYGMTPREFFRMGQYAWGIDGEVHITTDYDEMMVALSLAEGIVAHNGHNFDFSVLYGADSVTPLKLAQGGKLLDTFVWANLAFPAPVKYTSRSGATFYPKKPGDFMRWLSLDNLAFQLGVPGKMGDLKDLAKKHNPPKTKVADYDYGLIPLDDPDFIAYAEQDVRALQGVTRRLCLMSPMSAYDWREQTLAAIDAQNTRNGFMVDVEAVTARRDELAARRDEIRSYLEREYDFPTEGKAPWSSDKGKEVIIRVLKEAGISEDGWPRTPTGALQLGGEVILNLTTGTEAEEIGSAIAELKGQRSLSQLTIDSMKEDGKVHPDINSLQRSSRSSTTNPGLTVWTARGAGSVEKSYFVPDPGHKLVSFDYSNADARAVAGYSKDEAYRKNFLPGVDNHMNVALAVYGEEVVSDDPKTYRQLAKALSHAWNYGGGPNTISRASGRSIEEATHFVNQMNKAFPRVVQWRNEMAKMGERDGFIKNKWGRKMPVVKDQAYTQSSALLGQSGTREVKGDALLKMLDYDIRLIQWLKAQIHDELLFSIPESEIHWAVPKIKELMYYDWDGVEFYASAGEPADNWELAGH